MSSTSEQREAFDSWDSDHTSLVHVLWANGIKGADADRLASNIIHSKWFRAAKAHAVQEAALR